MNRKATPDILGAPMGGTKQESKVPVEQESNKAINKVSNKALKQTHFDGM